MKRTILFTFSLALLSMACKKQTFEDHIIQEVKDFNENVAPKRIDQATVYDSLKYDAASKTLSYYYTIEGDITTAMVPEEEIEKFQQGLLKKLRSSIQYKAHKEHGCAFHYTYILKNTGEKLIDCTFTPDDYQ